MTKDKEIDRLEVLAAKWLDEHTLDRRNDLVTPQALAVLLWTIFDEGVEFGLIAPEGHDGRVMAAPEVASREVNTYNEAKGNGELPVPVRDEGASVSSLLSHSISTRPEVDDKGMPVGPVDRELFKEQGVALAEAVNDRDHYKGLYERARDETIEECARICEHYASSECERGGSAGDVAFAAAGEIRRLRTTSPTTRTAEATKDSAPPASPKGDVVLSEHPATGAAVRAVDTATAAQGPDSGDGGERPALNAEAIGVTGGERPALCSSDATKTCRRCGEVDPTDGGMCGLGGRHSSADGDFEEGFDLATVQAIFCSSGSSLSQRMALLALVEQERRKAIASCIEVCKRVMVDYASVAENAPWLQDRHTGAQSCATRIENELLRSTSATPPRVTKEERAALAEAQRVAESAEKTLGEIRERFGLTDPSHPPKETKP